jgi:hypothetical protein
MPDRRALVNAIANILSADAVSHPSGDERSGLVGQSDFRIAGVCGTVTPSGADGVYPAPPRAGPASAHQD